MRSQNPTGNVPWEQKLSHMTIVILSGATGPT